MEEGKLGVSTSMFFTVPKRRTRMLTVPRYNANLNGRSFRLREREAGFAGKAKGSNRRCRLGAMRPYRSRTVACGDGAIRDSRNPVIGSKD